MDVKKLASRLIPGVEGIPVAEAHCDGPCGVYDPASARIAAEAARSMTKKLLDLAVPDSDDAQAVAAYANTSGRYVAIKEEQAELAKHELLVLWTDYFKPQHLEATPNLHELFWNATKLCSAAKQGVDVDACDQLMSSIEEIHNVFWASKGRDDVAFYLAR
jgi:nickel superoxide dismutase